MTLDLRAFSRTGGWFAAPLAAGNVRRKGISPAGIADEVDYTISELTLTRTLRADDDVGLNNIEMS